MFDTFTLNLKKKMNNLFKHLILQKIHYSQALF